MTSKKQIIECVPNFSEGRNEKNIDKIVAPFRNTSGVRLLDVQHDSDHNRLVVTAIGQPAGMKQAVLKAMAAAIGAIDMTQHQGQHPRMGAIDVVPFIPLQHITLPEMVAFSREVAEEASRQLSLPIFLYEASASQPHREDLAQVRKGEFEGMAEKMKQPEWQPDYGPAAIHPTVGATAMGARMPLVAFNVNLNTDKMDIANAIARRVRFRGGGLRYCKAIGVELADRGMVQVSMNLTNYTKTALYQAVELIRAEAARYGVSLAGSEIVGLVPMAALIDSTAYYLGLEDFSADQILESRLMA